MQQKSFQSGVTRIFIALFPVWLFYWVIWWPGEIMTNSAVIAYRMGYSVDHDTWGEKWWRIVGDDPFTYLLFVLGIPLVFYIATTIVIAVVYWVMDGFARRQP